MKIYLQKFTFFNTNSGFFGIAGTPKSVKKTTLPVDNKAEAERLLLSDSDGQAEYDPQYFNHLQSQIAAYFRGEDPGNFEDIQLDLTGMSDFAVKVLNSCRKIPPGQTVSYSQLASLAGHPGASRAVGTVLAKNPLPLLIPCHRVIKSDGNPGHFSATGGTKIKEKLLCLENTFLLKQSV